MATTHGGCSVHRLNMVLMPNTISQKNDARSIVIYPGQKQHFPSVLATAMANDKSPLCTFSPGSEWLEGWAFITVK